jgi:hypothetical protein
VNGYIGSKWPWLDSCKASEPMVLVSWSHSARLVPQCFPWHQVLSHDTLIRGFQHTYSSQWSSDDVCQLVYQAVMQEVAEIHNGVKSILS